MMRSFPLMLLVVLLYTVVAFGGTVLGGPTSPPCPAPGFVIPIFSGGKWLLSYSDLIVLFGILLLFIELIKATRATSVEVLNHALSTLVFALALVEFVVFPRFATSTFFMIVVMCLFDVIAAFTISTVAAKRELAVASVSSS
ncbi:MAG TPA: hypothetical protein VH722_08300 [Alphaproteobacteria bacterium]|nr:hypothetical protein [Alphaproteobacteria bacterium]